jgi:hypothetical protein
MQNDKEGLIVNETGVSRYNDDLLLQFDQFVVHGEMEKQQQV